MSHSFYVADRQSAVDAARLIDDHGTGAGAAALAAAGLCRDRGNVVHFCRWRQVGRLIEAMQALTDTQTRH